MLSILIPSYNYNVFPLVKSLNDLCVKKGCVFEIIATDDGSVSLCDTENERINTLDNCRFIKLKENIGLSRNRNFLAEQAKFDNLLFIDGDSVIRDGNFISNYLDNLEGTDIIYGGRKHPDTVEDSRKKLRWKYGKFVEDTTAAQRNTSIYKKLLCNNILIKTQVFDKVKFDPELKQYGHEDTVFAYHASLLNLRVKHIDNPVEHGDIDDNEVFISKIKRSQQNLVQIYKQKKLPADFVKLMWLYHMLIKTGLYLPVKLFYLVANKAIYKNLVSNNPSLFIFNLFRISYLCYIKDKPLIK